MGIDINTKPGLYANITWSYKDKQEVTLPWHQHGRNPWNQCDLYIQLCIVHHKRSELKLRGQP